MDKGAKMKEELIKKITKTSRELGDVLTRNVEDIENHADRAYVMLRSVSKLVALCFGPLPGSKGELNMIWNEFIKLTADEIRDFISFMDEVKDEV